MSNKKLVWIRFTEIWSERVFYIAEREADMAEKESISEYGCTCRLQTEIKYRITKLTKNEQ